jgi:hypothetical protein
MNYFLIKNDNEFINVNTTTVIYDWFASISYNCSNSLTDLNVSTTYGRLGYPHFISLIEIINLVIL